MEGFWNTKQLGSVNWKYFDVFSAINLQKQSFKERKKYFFKYLQIRNVINSQIQTFTQPKWSNIEKYVTTYLKGRGQLSVLYNMLIAAQKDNCLSFLSAWKKDLQTDISLEQWEKSCLQAQTQTINTKCRLIQYKWLLRTYITPVKWHHFDSKLSDKCYKCKTETGNLVHCLWECTQLQTFWHEVLVYSSKLIVFTLPVDVSSANIPL